jgi:hypothetical protein
MITENTSVTNAPQKPIPPRPSTGAPAAYGAAAYRLAEHIREWLMEQPDYVEDADSLVSIVDAIENARLAPYDNGYQIAKELEDEGYTPDSQFVEICDNWSLYYSEEVNRLFEQWVKAYNVKPTLPVGAKVEITQRRVVKQGFINDLRIETAQYVVGVPEDGHEPGSRNGYIVNYEDVVAV